MWSKVGKIEFEDHIYGKCVIRIYDRENHIIKTIKPLWSKREEVFNKINNQWIGYLKKEKR